MKLTIWLNIKIYAAILLVLSVGSVTAQTTLTLDEVQQKTRQNYPMIKQQELLKKIEQAGIANLNANYFPQLAINGQASYQSDVTAVKIPVPGVTIESLDKEQYKLTADVSQVLFDGGVTEQQRKLQHLSTAVEQQKLEVELYKLRERVNQVYLTILYLDEQIKQAELIKKDIQDGAAKTKAQVANGVAFRSNLDLITAELLKAEQRTAELQASREGLLNTLSLFMAEALDKTTQLTVPESPVLNAAINRPELSLYDKQESLLERQKHLITARNLPKLSAFGQGGYIKSGS